MFRAREIGVKTGSGEFRAKGNTEYLYCFDKDLLNLVDSAKSAAEAGRGA